jgi:hypothetical protein
MHARQRSPVVAAVHIRVAAAVHAAAEGALEQPPPAVARQAPRTNRRIAC